MSVALTIVEQTINEPNLLWDTTWDGFIGDWAPNQPVPSGSQIGFDFAIGVSAVGSGSLLGGSASDPNYGGLRARAPLHTAILLCLMSDVRAGPNDFIPDGSGDPRGWAGDAIDSSLAPLGSKLWLLRRRELTPEVADLAVIYARMALQTLVTQGAVAKIDAVGEAVLETGRLNLGVSLYKTDGTVAAAMNFSLMWNEENGVQHPLAP